MASECLNLEYEVCEGNVHKAKTNQGHNNFHIAILYIEIHSSHY